jgi:prolyl-tRNA editing enzyme YbaK/EbsC (Cys-tRNA(Pro) deacylase)
MSVEKVREYLTPYGVADRMQEFTVSSATVELAAQAVGVEGARIAKTLSFKVNEQPILVVAAGDAKVDNSKYKHFFHAKAKMLTPDEAVERIGHAVGGVCPFALPADVKTYLDISLRRFETVFPAVGSAASAIELTCDELQTCCGPNFVEWVDVCKGWQEEPAE